MAESTKGVWRLQDVRDAILAGAWNYNDYSVIGTQGAQGFGVGPYPLTLPSGFTTMAGTTDPASDNYGNYTTTNGSIMVYVPRFYYRIGSASSPRYATYGLNSIDVVGMNTYTTESAANADGFAMHRAFKDGGVDLLGFFMDKYLASKDGVSTCKSIFGADPISLTTDVRYNPSNGMTGCTGILADAVVLSRARGTGFHCASAFQYSAMALLSLAHGQASTNTTNCDWYNVTHNFPKGCNNNALADVNDTSVTYANSYDNKPKCGAITNFARTTHNGQNSGVADLNGSMGQALLGITDYGTWDTDTSPHANGNAYVLKTSVAISSLTGGWNTGTDAWGNTTHLGTLYNAVSLLYPWGSTTGATWFGYGGNQVFSPAVSGTDWLRTGSGIQASTASTSEPGTALFGSDHCYRFNCANLMPMGNGTWGSAGGAGVFSRFWNYTRSGGDSFSGFRCAFCA